MTIGIREIARNSKLFEEYDYFDVEDKKTHEYKGVFISAKFAQDVKKMIEEKIQIEKKKEIDEMLTFSGITSIKNEFNDLSSKEIKKKYSEKF